MFLKENIFFYSYKKVSLQFEEILKNSIIILIITYALGATNDHSLVLGSLTKV